MAVSHETFRRGRNALVVFHAFCLKSEGKLHSNLSKDEMQMDKTPLNQWTASKIHIHMFWLLGAS